MLIIDTIIQAAPTGHIGTVYGRLGNLYDNSKWGSKPNEWWYVVMHYLAHKMEPVDADN